MRLKQKVAIVTGGASGIGAAIAERFAEEGAVVVAADLAAAEGWHEAAAGRIEHRLDVSDAASVERLVAATVQRFGAIHVLVNSAGIGRNMPFLETPVAVLEEILSVNLKGTFLISQRVARAMAEQRSGGAIVNLGSISGERGNLGRAAYGASKGGIDTLSQVMAVELAPHRIRVNVIAPGPIETPLVRSMLNESERRVWTRRIPLGRYGRVEEVAAAAVFLASDDASYITGHVLAVDGGFLAAGANEAPPQVS